MIFVVVVLLPLQQYFIRGQLLLVFLQMAANVAVLRIVWAEMFGLPFLDMSYDSTLQWVPHPTDQEMCHNTGHIIPLWPNPANV